MYSATCLLCLCLCVRVCGDSGEGGGGRGRGLEEVEGVEGVSTSRRGRPRGLRLVCLYLLNFVSVVCGPGGPPECPFPLPPPCPLPSTPVPFPSSCPYLLPPSPPPSSSAEAPAEKSAVLLRPLMSSNAEFLALRYLSRVGQRREVIHGRCQRGVRGHDNAATYFKRRCSILLARLWSRNLR